MTNHRPPIRLPRRGPDLRVELTPLIDVVFLLLTFFIFSIVLMVRVDALDVRLPELTGAADAPRGTLVTVAITRDGTLTLQGEPIELTALADAATTAIEAATTNDQAPRLVLAVDADAPSSALITVGGELARNGLGGFSLIGVPADQPSPATQPPTPANTPKP